MLFLIAFLVFTILIIILGAGESGSGFSFHADRHSASGPLARSIRRHRRPRRHVPPQPTWRAPDTGKPNLAARPITHVDSATRIHRP